MDTVRPYPENILAILLREWQVNPEDDEMFEIIGNFKDMLMTLTKIEKTMLKLYYAEHLSIRDISRTTGFPEKAVQGRLSQILIRCKTEWKSRILTTKRKEKEEKMAAYSKHLQNIHIADYPLRNYKISPRAVHSLEFHNIWGLEQISSINQLLLIPNIGPKAIEEIRLALETAGLSVT